MKSFQKHFQLVFNVKFRQARFVLNLLLSLFQLEFLLFPIKKKFAGIPLPKTFVISSRKIISIISI